MTHISRIKIDESELGEPGSVVEQERRVAAYDLLEDNSFTLPGREGQPAPKGPFALKLGNRDDRLVFDISGEDGEQIVAFHLSLGPFRQVVKDYFQICASYYDAVKTMPPAQIEAIDMGRRGIHNEGARILQERLEGKAEIDADTSRRLFTLICALIPHD